LIEVCGLSDAQLNELGKSVDGQVGQIVSFDAASGQVQVCLLSGVSCLLDPKNLEAATDVQKPGEGGSGESFDILLGPGTIAAALTHELTMCLMEKGFCVIRMCQSDNFHVPAIETLHKMGDDGRLSRLPEEVEAGYLGHACQGKVAWLDTADTDLENAQQLLDNDNILSYLAQVFQGFSGDVCNGEFIDERTPALICLSLLSDEDAEYPYPEADNETLGTFLETYKRSLLRAVSFLGPRTPDVVLEKREGEKYRDVVDKLPKISEAVSIKGAPGTILLFRPDCYEYTCSIENHAETLMLLTNYLSAAPDIVVGPLEGDAEWLISSGGPPPPPGRDHINVHNTTSRLPANIDNQWSYLSALAGDTDTVSKTPIQRWDTDVYYHEDEDTMQPWQTNIQHTGTIEGVELFDNRHFEISNTEAGGMDPVQRHILEQGALNLALYGLDRKTCARKSTHAGVAVGNDKLDWGPMDKQCDLGALGGTSTVLAIIANRFSFVYNLKGPSFVCDTACSASLCSSHCAKLMMYERVYDPIDWFLSFGAHLILRGPIMNPAHMHSPGGRCFTFNASADGYLRGEGFACCLMEWAGIDSEMDAIYRSSACGQDGRSASLTAPNGPAQEEMIRKAINEAKMTPPESTVWECHGTGTSLGDPIEVGAVRKVQVKMARQEPLMIGSNKTNIGHLEGGAAMGAMVKCVLQCKMCYCAPTVHIRTLNPHLEHAAFDAIFISEPAPFRYRQGHCQVSSFGFGGSNGHAVFWGKLKGFKPDVEAAFMSRVKQMPAPQVRVAGDSPDDWESDFPDWKNAKPGTTYQLALSPEDPVTMPLKFRMVDESQDAPEDEEEDTYYSLTGNYNDWQEDRMLEGSVPGLSIASVEIPDDGILEFHFLKNGDEDQVLGPAQEECSKKLIPIIGPEANLPNKWVVKGEPGDEIQIELFIKDGMRSITWFCRT